MCVLTPGFAIGACKPNGVDAPVASQTAMGMDLAVTATTALLVLLVRSRWRFNYDYEPITRPPEEAVRIRLSARGQLQRY